MAGMCCIGSGKTASRFCKPGTYFEFSRQWFEETDPQLIEALKQPGFKRNDTQQALIDGRKSPAHRDTPFISTYMTDCSHRVLEGLSAWQGRQEHFDFVTFVELCNPGGPDGFQDDQGQGFAPAKSSRDRQCGFGFYNALEGIFPRRDYGYILNSNIVGPTISAHILTLYKKASFPSLTQVIQTEIISGRPVTALVFEDGTLLVSVHGVHFRKTLINGDPGCKNADCDMLRHLDKHEKCKGKGLLANIEARNQTDAFSAIKFSSADLQDIFGSWLERQITEGLHISHRDNMVSKIKAKKSIIMAGDFNDEMSDLYSIPLFDSVVSIPSSKRKRTCCSDRDIRWLTHVDRARGLNADNAGWTKQKNYEYLSAGEKQCGYLPNVESAQHYLDGKLESMDAARTDVPGKNSEYPFPSDIILSTNGVDDFGFPPRYVQDINKPMSDHDPVVATISI
jgi:hypothetical protein